MDFFSMKEWFTIENMMDLIEKYRSFGPLPSILLPMIEAFLPFLPLFLIVMASANAFGLGWGFLFSWIGASVGALLVFLLVRRYGEARFFRFLQRKEKVQSLTNWVERHGFGPLFLLLCFPFTPSAIVNIVAGISRINIYQYMLAVLAGKAVMIFIMSFIGYDIISLIKQPIRTAIALGIIGILWYVGKRIEGKLKVKMEKQENDG
ncbi:TVP38/TMEM64 family protein [Lederbergia lenta]|uniref:TVP38/TMEM64 family membrane protein n=1 Tax=Lederbergia lenta TaxID=1467 RepID=A0A2X4WTH9_LEDLE|nr:TVP38/TMEM64 family protein [Lederbergia lenta]MCM3110484.1 TVP38/TMEM64 family protein [Lederbergia lenta]MEC2323950.1 TVP38/TMEM64 family protein [Lederbergia lenta]SQI60940.1 putative integral inner membrane protein [Lederbergia lenta]